MSSPGILVAQASAPLSLLTRYGNRHGLVAGATGTGKTVTVQTLAEGFSAAGVPVFLADVKGDLAGLSQAGGGNQRVTERLAKLGLSARPYQGSPVIFWDLLSARGHRARATVSEVGPALLARMLGLNETQASVLSVVFQAADDQGLLILDWKDLRSVLQYAAENAKALSAQYGNLAPATLATIQRSLLGLQQEGAEGFFGEPALDLADLMMVAPDGRGAVSVLVADALLQRPRLYSAFLLYLLAQLFEALPEVGDLDKPKLALFFDEAHLLFKELPSTLLEKLETVVRLIRSRGVGLYFISQNPSDIPDSILGQLGNRVQHALRAYTPKDQKAVQAAADGFRPNPAFQTADAITELQVGEALVSFLDETGAPAPVQRAWVVPPRSRLGAITDAERAAVLAQSPVGSRYDQVEDRESAFERLSRPAAPAPAPAATAQGTGAWQRGTVSGRPAPAAAPAASAPAPAPSGPSLAEQIFLGTNRRQGVAEAMAKSVARSVGSQVGRSLVRGILGSLLK